MNRTTKLLLALLIVLGAIAYFLLPSDKEREASYSTAQLSLKVDSAAVVKIEIQRTGKSVTIENVGGAWTITSPGRYEADSKAITQIIGGFCRFTVGSLVSSNPEKQHVFQVDSSGTLVTLTDRSGKVVSMIIGKMGPSFSEVYFRLPTSKDVYLGEGIESWAVNKDVKDWRDKTIFTSPSEVIHEVSLTSGSRYLAFSRDSTGWKAGDKPADMSTLNPLLNTLGSLRADDFADTVSRIDLRPITIGIKGAENVTLNLYPLMPDSTKFFVQSSAKPQMFVVSKWTAQQLMKPFEKPATVQKPRQVAEAPAQEAPPPPAAKERKPAVTPPVKHEITKAAPPKVEQPPVKQPQKETAKEMQPPQVKQPQKETAKEAQPPAVKPPAGGGQKPQPAAEDEGELTVHTVGKGETMTTIARKYGVTPEQIIKWNLLKTIAVKPGQELYIYIKK
jgi:LysM repeat protein